MLEFFLKYPQSVYSRGQFALLGAWPKWVLALLIVAAAVALAWRIRAHLPKAAPNMRGWRAWVVWGLESLMAAILLVLLWHPAITIAELKPQQNIIAVLVDDSKSMSTSEDGKTREDQARQTLDGGLLASLNRTFRTQLYRFDDGLSRIDGTKDLLPNAPSTHIGESLQQFVSETSDLPIGAVVLVSDGSDNSGGVSADAIEALRARHIPVHTIGIGREKAERDVELDDAIVAPRALAGSRLAAKVTFHQRGFASAKVAITIREATGEPSKVVAVQQVPALPGGGPRLQMSMSDATAGKMLASKTVTLGAEGTQQTETLMFDIGSAGAKTLRIDAVPLSGEANQANNTLTRLVNVSSDPRRILYIEGEPRWEYKFIRQAEQDDRMVQVISSVRTSENKTYRQGIADPKELANGFPTRAEDLFAYQGLVIGSVEAGFFSPLQQELIHDFVDRRGGGLLLLGGQYSLADGAWSASKIVDLMPTTLPAGTGTFHREADPRNGTTHAVAELAPAGVDSVVTRLVDDSQANIAKWKTMPYLMDYEDPGTPKAGATLLLNTITPEGRKVPLLITENFGRGRSAIMATGGSWRWQMSLALGDTAHDRFWQQLLRWVAADTPGHVKATVASQILLDRANVTITADVRDAQYNPARDAHVEAHILGPDNIGALVEMSPVPDRPGEFQAVWPAPKAGAYFTEVTAQRVEGGAVKEIGRDVLTFERLDGVAESFHAEQNRELLERIANQTGGQYWKPADASKLAGSVKFSEAGVTMRETKDLWDLPLVFLVLIALRFSEWWLRRTWGIV